MISWYVGGYAPKKGRFESDLQGRCVKRQHVLSDDGGSFYRCTVGWLLTTLTISFRHPLRRRSPVASLCFRLSPRLAIKHTIRHILCLRRGYDLRRANSRCWQNIVVRDWVAGYYLSYVETSPLIRVSWLLWTDFARIKCYSIAIIFIYWETNWRQHRLVGSASTTTTTTTDAAEKSINEWFIKHL